MEIYKELKSVFPNISKEEFNNCIENIKNTFSVSDEIILIILTEIMNEKKKTSKKTFPFKRTFMTDTDIIKMMNNLSNYDYQKAKINLKIPLELSSKPSNGIYSFILPKDEYESLNNVSDYFNEENRLSAFKNNKQSPLDYYFENYEKIYSQAQKNCNCEPSNFELREILYKIYPYEAESFKPSHVVAISKRYSHSFDSSISMLDISAGWGDRLIGAIASKIDYTGVDPNPNVHKGYKKIIEFAKKYNLLHSNINLLQCGFEDCDLGNKMFDFVLTSPPYFDLEIYEEYNKKQSTNKFKSLEKWFYGFLMTSLKKASDHLVDGGYLIINIQDDSKHYFVNRMIEEFIRHPGIEFYEILLTGKFNSNEGDFGRPFFVFKKTSKFNLNPPLYITPFWVKKNIFIVRDDVLPGGTKQRAVVEFLKDKIKKGFNEFVYAGPFTGAAQIALAIGCKQLGVKATVFTSKVRPRSQQTQNAIRFGANIIDDEEKIQIKDLDKKAENYVSEKPNERLKMPFGFDDKIFRETMVKNIKNAVSKAYISKAYLGERRFKKIPLFDFNKKRTIFLVGGSATLLNILYEVFPKYDFVVVQVGKTIWPDQINDRTKIYIAPEKFNENAKHPPPYPSIQNYDAKVWWYVTKYGKDGDIVWNVK